MSGVLGEKLQSCLVENGLRGTTRGIGQNKVGMVGFICKFMDESTTSKTSQFVLIANDITHQAGSFGVEEDKVYQRLSKLARDLKLPRIYISSNSG